MRGRWCMFQGEELSEHQSNMHWFCGASLPDSRTPGFTVLPMSGWGHQRVRGDTPCAALVRVGEWFGTWALSGPGPTVLYCRHHDPSYSRQVLLSVPFQERENWGLEKVNHWPRVAKLMHAKVRIQLLHRGRCFKAWTLKSDYLMVIPALLLASCEVFNTLLHLPKPPLSSVKL